MATTNSCQPPINMDDGSSQDGEVQLIGCFNENEPRPGAVVLPKLYPSAEKWHQFLSLIPSSLSQSQPSPSTPSSQRPPTINRRRLFSEAEMSSSQTGVPSSQRQPVADLHPDKPKLTFSQGLALVRRPKRCPSTPNKSLNDSTASSSTSTSSSHEDENRSPTDINGNHLNLTPAKRQRPKAGKRTPKKAKKTPSPTIPSLMEMMDQALALFEEDPARRNVGKPTIELTSPRQGRLRIVPHSPSSLRFHI